MKLPLLLTLFLAACDPATGVDYEQCELDLRLDPSEGAPGSAVVATGRPITADFDTVVRVGGVEAAVIEADRASCTACDTCRSDARCGVCTACAECAEACEACTETITFEVPALPAGPTTASVANGYGASLPLPFVVLE